MIGGGIIGLAVARELASDGWRVTVLEKGQPGREASSAAAGMLTPRLELGQGSPLLAAGLASKELYPAFARELEEETGLGINLRLNGVVAPIFPEDETRPVPDFAIRVEGAALRALEPSLSCEVREALYFADEGSVDNRALVAAVLASARLRRVEVLSYTEAERVVTAGDRVCGVSCRGASSPLGAELVVNCAGAWAGDVSVPGGEVRVRPVKGQMLCLDAGQLGTRGPLRTVYSHHAYLVPRGDGRVIVGTTVEDRGYDKTVEAGAVSKLIEGAVKLCPALASARLVEVWAGLRPRGEDAAPRIGPVGPGGYFVAVGHYRNGILLAPWTARRLRERIAAHPYRAAPASSTTP